MAGFLKGVLAGLALAVAGFVAFALLLPANPYSLATPPVEAAGEGEAPAQPPSAVRAGSGAGTPPPVGDEHEPDGDRNGTSGADVSSEVSEAVSAPETEPVSSAGSELIADAAAGEDAALQAVDGDNPAARDADPETATAAAPDAASVDDEAPAEDAAGEAAEPAPGIASDSAATPPAPETAAELAAWRRHAADYEPPVGRALYAVILVDAAPDPRVEAALLELPAPVTIALDPEDADAPRRARAYRSAGHEVALLAPPRMDAAALAAQRAAFPEALAWIAAPSADTPDADARDLARLVAAAGAVLVLRDETPAPLTGTEAPSARVVQTVDPALGRRAAVFPLLDGAGGAASEGTVPVIIGQASHTALRGALMRRTRHASDAPAVPAPLGAAIAAAR